MTHRRITPPQLRELERRVSRSIKLVEHYHHELLVDRIEKFKEQMRARNLINRRLRRKKDW